MIRTYLQASRAPRYSLLFALPLLIFYQVLAALAPPAPGGMVVRNGADVILESVFVWLAGAWGPRLFMLCLIGVGAWLIARDLRTNRNLSPAVLGGMLLESVCLSLVFGVVVGGLTAALLGAPPPPLMLDFTAQRLSRWTMLMLSLGAGIYEELLFRVVLVGLLAWGAKKLLGWRPLIAGIADRARRAHFLRLPLYRPLWGSPRRLFLRLSHHRRTVFQRPVPAPRIWHNCFDSRTLRRTAVA